MRKGLLLLFVLLSAVGLRAQDALAPISVTPADNSLVNKLDVITLAFDEEVDVNDAIETVTVVSVESGETVVTGKVAYDYEEYTQVNVTLDEAINTLGEYRLVIPAGAIFAVADEARVTAELAYTYTVDPDYWDPAWVEKVSGTSQTSPAKLVVGRKYGFSDMYNYATFTATEDGRLYINKLDEEYSSVTRCDETWYNLGYFNKTDDGNLWIGVTAGQVVYIQEYGFSERSYQIAFEAGSPYNAIEYTGSYPTDGGLLSKSIEAPKSYEMGTVEFYFNTKVNKDEVKVYMIIPSQDDKKVEITDDVELRDGTIYGTTTSYLAVVMDMAIDEVFKSEYGLQIGDKIQIVLENVQDNDFAINALTENPKVEVVLAATVCISANPNPSYGVDAIPAELSLRFDNNVACANVKGSIIDVKSGNCQEFVLDSVVCEERVMWDDSKEYETIITLPEATIELTSKKFAIQLEGLVDTAGNVVSYGDEFGKFVINYKMRDDNFNYVTADPENGSNVTSLKSVKLTFGEKVNLNPEAEAPYFYAGETEVVGIMEVDPNDEKSVIITWSEEVTAAGSYYPTIPKGAIYNSMYDATKEDLGVEDGAGYNPYINLEYSILADVSATTVTAITPDPDASFSINELPAEIVIECDGNVKEVINAYGMASRWSTRNTTIPEDAYVLGSKVEGNKIVLTIPAEVIASATMGNFNITVNAIGEDDKPIGSANDPYAESISISYYILKMLQMTEAVPADGATVKELSTVTLTFDSNIGELDAMYDAPCLFDADWNKVADFAYAFEGNQVTLTLAEPVTTAGQYLVYVPGDFIYDVTWVTNGEINLNVTVGDAPAVDELSIVSATPENGATVENLTTVEFKLSKEVGYLYKSMLIPSDGADDAHYASLTQSETDPTSYTLDFTILSENGAILRKDVTYTMTLEAWASEDAYNRNQGTPETVTLTYVGASEGFQYSGLKLESITPAEDFVISDKSQNKFVVKFNGPVTLVESLTYINMGQGATEKFESIVANDGQTEYTLTIAESVLATIRGTVNIVLAANDLDGLRLQGNNGEGEYSTFAYYYTTTIGVPDLTITPDAAAEQATLVTITIGCTEGLVPSWTAGNITLTDANGKAVELNDPEAVVAEGADEWATPTAWTVALKEELTAIGTYTLTIPAGYFNIGSTQGQVMGNKKTEVVFNITQAAKDAAGIKGVTVDSDVVVYNIAGVAVANGKASEVLKNLNKGIYIVNGKKYVVK